MVDASTRTAVFCAADTDGGGLIRENRNPAQAAADPHDGRFPAHPRHSANIRGTSVIPYPAIHNRTRG